MKLRDVAHARTGDKGDTCSISVIARRIEDFPLILDHVTPERVKEWFGSVVSGKVERFELPRLGALNLVLHNALGGGVTRSLAVDMHGKTLGSALLEMPLDA